MQKLVIKHIPSVSISHTKSWSFNAQVLYPPTPFFLSTFFALLPWSSVGHGIRWRVRGLLVENRRWCLLGDTLRYRVVNRKDVHAQCQDLREERSFDTNYAFKDQTHCLKRKAFAGTRQKITLSIRRKWGYFITCFILLVSNCYEN